MACLIVTKVHPPFLCLCVSHAEFHLSDEDQDCIGVEGTEKFCIDLGIDPTDVVMLVICWYMNAQKMCEFTREEWMKGWKELGCVWLVTVFVPMFMLYRCDSVDALKLRLPELRRRLKSDEDLFHQVYNYSFQFSRDEPSQKSLCAFI
jgi:DCN1-like protein 1/2